MAEGKQLPNHPHTAEIHNVLEAALDAISKLRKGLGEDPLDEDQRADWHLAMLEAEIGYWNETEEGGNWVGGTDE